MIKKYNQFIKESQSIVSDDEILDFLVKLDTLSKHYDQTSEEGSSSDLQYEHKGNVIKISYGWSTYEEGSHKELVIDLTTLEVSYQEHTSSVYGDYQNEGKRKFNSLEDIYQEYFDESILENDWTDKEKKKLEEIGFSDFERGYYQREVSYEDIVYDEVSKSSPTSYYGVKYSREGDRWDYEWVSESDNFDNFDSLISFLEN